MTSQSDFNQNPPVTLREVEEWARRALLPGTFDWLQSAAGIGLTPRADRRAFQRAALRPRVLRDVSNLDTSTTFLGQELSLPVIVAPLGHLTQFHEDGEAELALGTEGEGSILFISTQTRISLREVREYSPNSRLAWQVYFYGSREWVEGQVKEAEQLGAVAICVCVDGPKRPVRYLDREARYDGRDHGRFSAPRVPDTLMNLRTTWKDMEWLRSATGLPLILKGIMTPEDARLAIDIGADCVWVSNHGGRTVDSGLATLEVIEEIRGEVGPDYPLVLDGGVRTGSDVVRAIALGADLVAIGRPAAYGLAAGGAEGVHKVFELLREEVDATMANCGLSNVSEITRDFVRWVNV